MIHFKVVIPMFNVEKWIGKCLSSIKVQNFTNFECIIIDDMSTDKTVEVVKKCIQGDKRFKLIVNKTKKYALQNIYEGIQFLAPNDDDVIITVDGDDWLHNKNVLKIINNVYNKHNCLLTYGNYVRHPVNEYRRLGSYPPAIIRANKYRHKGWIASHPRTFKYVLWKNIKRADLLDTSGNFYRMAWDLAMMFPMLEMSGGRFVNIDKPLYVYNDANPLNDHKINRKYQCQMDKQIRQKKKYTVLKISNIK